MDILSAKTSLQTRKTIVCDLLHKSTNNHSQRFRRSYVSHYLSAQAEWFDPKKIGKGQPVMWVRGQTFPGKVREVERDVLPIRD